MSDTNLTDAMCQDDFCVNHDSTPPEIYVPAEFARGLERDVVRLKSNLVLLSQYAGHTQVCLMNPRQPCNCGLEKLLKEIKI